MDVNGLLYVGWLSLVGRGFTGLGLFVPGINPKILEASSVQVPT